MKIFRYNRHVQSFTFSFTSWLISSSQTKQRLATAFNVKACAHQSCLPHFEYRDETEISRADHNFHCSYTQRETGPDNLHGHANTTDASLPSGRRSAVTYLRQLLPIPGFVFQLDGQHQQRLRCRHYRQQQPLQTCFTGPLELNAVCGLYLPTT